MAEHYKRAMEIEYKTQAGDVLRLNLNIVRQYLVTGKKHLVTDQELVFFMHTCRARKLNPFIKECYLIKYTQNDPAAVIVSVDYLRKNARKAKDCLGWQVGVVIKENDKLTFREGSIVLPDEELVGGWAQAKPANWPQPFFWSVPLHPYIRRKADGTVTRFWQSEKQAEMISKVAEAQLLRRLWGEETSALLTLEELPITDETIIHAPTAIELKTEAGQKKQQVADKIKEVKQKTDAVAGSPDFGFQAAEEPSSTSEEEQGEPKPEELPEYDPDTLFQEYTGVETQTFNRLRKVGFRRFIDKHIDKMNEWPSKLIDIVSAKALALGMSKETFDSMLSKKISLNAAFAKADSPSQPSATDEQKDNYLTCPLTGPYSGKRVSPAIVCSGCSKAAECEPYAEYRFEAESEVNELF